MMIIAFVLGFAVGVFERKIDRLKVNQNSLVELFGKESKKAEILKTPSREKLDEEEKKTFYRSIR